MADIKYEIVKEIGILSEEAVKVKELLNQLGVLGR